MDISTGTTTETGTTTITAGTSAVNHSAMAIIAVGTKDAAAVIAVAADRAACSTTANCASWCWR